jgi:hypothetical protein
MIFSSLSLKSQVLPTLKLNDNVNQMSLTGSSTNSLLATSKFDFMNKSLNSLTQVKKRKALNMYVGAGYTFVIFTSSGMNTAYPVLDTRSGDFLSEINLFFGFAVAKAVEFEIEPDILFTHNNRVITILLPQSRRVFDSTYNYVFPQTMSMLAFPMALNVRFFPLYSMKNFARLFFVGGGVGAVWIREEYDNSYSNNPSNYFYGNNYYYTPIITESTNQFTPLFRIMTGFTGSGGAFGFGGEVRYNIVPLKQTNEPFASRLASNFNSVDIVLRFYFSL